MVLVAFPSPTTLRQIGECLLRQGKPADATFYLAAAGGMTPYGMHVKPLLLLIKALFIARETDHALMRLRQLAEEMYLEMTEAISANSERAVEELLQRVA